jgi:hypothetical protein
VLHCSDKNLRFSGLFGISDCARHVNFGHLFMSFDSLRSESRSGVGIAAKRTGQRCHHEQILAAL